MPQRQLVIKALVIQSDIEDLVRTRYTITHFHCIAWMWSSVIVTIYRTIAPLQSYENTAATLGGGFFVGILIGYALKKVIKIVAVIVGLFLAGLAYLQYHQIDNINWNKIQQVSEATIATLSNTITQMPAFGYTSDQAATASSFTMTSFGIPLTGSMSAGFTIGFLKGS